MDEADDGYYTHVEFYPSIGKRLNGRIAEARSNRVILKGGTTGGDVL